MGFFEVILGLVGLGGLGIISIAGVIFYAIRRDFNQEQHRLSIKKMIEERKLEEVRQENYLLENEDMRLELDRIKGERLLEEEKNGKHNRWLIRETERNSK